MEEIFSAIESGNRKVLVRSCNGAGKTTALAALCLWKLTQFENSIVLTTASSWTQVTRSLWGEIRRLARIHGEIAEKDIAATQIKLDDKHFAIGISPTQVENAQGFHAQHMLIAVDEATGVERDIIDALMGNLTSKDAQIVLIYNPIDTSSFPYEAEAKGDWELITISAFEHPNVIEGKELIPGAVTREWIDDRMFAWSYRVDPAHGTEQAIQLPWTGEWWRKTERVASRICGEWPEVGGEGFIEMSLIARSRSLEPIPGVRSLGVDVARSGDDKTVFAFFDGNHQLPFEQYQGKDLMKTANRIQELYNEGWKCIAIDDTGIGGGVTDRLRELGIEVHAIHFGAGANNFTGKYKQTANIRTELYFCLEEELRRGEIILTHDRELDQELTAIRLAPDDSNGVYYLEPKEKISARLGRSPDKADATALARYGLKLDRYRGMPKFH